MKLTYNPDRNIAYFALREKAPEESLETLKLSDDVWLDLSADGRIYGIELLNPNAMLREQPIFSIVNEATHSEQLIPMR